MQSRRKKEGVIFGCILTAEAEKLSPCPQAISVVGRERADGARSMVELSWAMQSGGDQGTRLARESTTQQSHGWGLALLALRTAVLPLLFSTAQCKIQSADTPLPPWVAVVS